MYNNNLNYWCGYWAGVPDAAEKYIFIPKAGGGCYTIIYLSSCCIGKEMWYFTFDNCLHKINIETGVNELIYEFNENEIWSYWQPVYASGWIVALPLWGSTIAAYNICDGRVKICSAVGFERACRIGYYDGKVFYWSAINQKVICYTIETNTINEVNMEKNFEHYCIPYEMTSIAMVGTKGYFVAFGSNILYEFDIVTQKIDMHVINCANMTFSSVTFYKDGLFLLSMQADKAVFWQPGTQDALVWTYVSDEDKWSSRMMKLSSERKIYILPSNELANNTHHISELVPRIWKNGIAILNNENDIYNFDIMTGKVERINVFSNVLKYKLCRFNDIIDNEICLLPVYDDSTMYFSDGRVLQLVDGLGYKALSVSSKDSVLDETQLWTLEKYISVVKGQG